MRVRRRRYCQEEKEQSRQSRAPDREEGESQGKRELNPSMGESDQREHEEEMVTPQ